MRKKLLPSSHACMLFPTNPCNFEIFKTVMKYFRKGCFSYTNASNFWRPLQSLRQKILRLPNFNMLFQLALTKFFKSEMFSCLPKVGHVIKSCEEPIILSNKSLSSE